MTLYRKQDPEKSRDVYLSFKGTADDIIRILTSSEFKGGSESSMGKVRVYTPAGSGSASIKVSADKGIVTLKGHVDPATYKKIMTYIDLKPNITAR